SDSRRRSGARRSSAGAGRRTSPSASPTWRARRRASSPARRSTSTVATGTTEGRGCVTSERGFDVVIVGGGHNGLTAGCYLAKAGRSVLVLEARDVVGGGCATEEVAAPGFRHNFHSNFHGIIHMGPVYRDLELERYGARYVWPENQFAHVFPDGRALVCSRELERTVENVARFSKRDAE